jgi:hypothetical protein
MDRLNLTVSGSTRLDAVDNAEIDPQDKANVLVQDPLEGEDDVGRVERLAIVELHSRSSRDRSPEASVQILLP